MVASLAAHLGRRNFKTKDAHSDILPRFFSVAGASVPRLQQIKQKKKGKKGI
jgi:hypothetical protein